MAAVVWPSTFAEARNHLRHHRIMRARHQCVDRQVMWTDAVSGDQLPTGQVIARIDRWRALERPEVGDVRHHKEERIAPRIGADRQGFCVSICASATDMDLSSAVCSAEASGPM